MVNQRFDMRRDDYDDIILLAQDYDAPATEITQELYLYLMQVLLPTTVLGHDYFLYEMITDTITVQFNTFDGKYYAKYVDVTKPHTFLDRDKIEKALPVDHNDWVGYASC